MRQQGEAAIVCGTEDGVGGDMPTGDVSNLEAGTPVYCRAVALEDAESVTWYIDNGTLGSNTSGDGAKNTVGPDPEASAVFTLGTDGTPQVRVEFTDGNGDTHVVTPRFQTAQELAQGLLDIAFYDAVEIGYYPSLDSLTYHLTKTSDPSPISSDSVVPAPHSDFGSRLRSATGLYGLSPTDDDFVEIDVTETQLNITFGVILVDDVADITPSDTITSTLDRFFIQVRTGDGDYEFIVEDAAINATVDLEGRLGFLEVSATGNALANTANSAAAFEITRTNTLSPMLGVNITPPAGVITITDTSGITDAILIGDLLEDMENCVKSHVNLKMSAGLQVVAEVGDPPSTLASGSVAIDWPDITDSGLLTIAPSDGFNENLKVFDLAPTLTGVCDRDPSAYPSGSALHDSTFDFSILGEDVLLNAFVTNTTDGSTGRIRTITDTHTLDCPLEGGTVFLFGVGLVFEGDSVEDEDKVLAAEFRQKFKDEEIPLSADASITITTEVVDKEWRIHDSSYDRTYLVLKESDRLNVYEIDNNWDLDDGYEIAGNPEVLMRLILNNLFDLAGRMEGLTGDDVDDLETNLPLTGVSPKDLLPQFANLRTAIGQIRTGEPDATIIWGRDDGNPPTGSVTTATVGSLIYCRAITPITTTVTGVEWTMAGGIPFDKTSDPATVGANPTESAVFTVMHPGGVHPSEGFQVSVVFTDTWGTHTAQVPRTGPPTSLQELEEALESKLDIPASALTFELKNLPKPGSTSGNTKHLVMRLAYGICTEGNPDAQPNDRVVPKKEVRLSLDLQDASLPPLIATEVNDSFQLEYASRVQLDVGIPLSRTLALTGTVVLDTSGVTVTVAMTNTEVALQANIGPLSVTVGASAVITGTHTEKPIIGTHTVAITSTTVLTDTTKDFLALGVMPGSTITNTNPAKNVTCTVTSVGQYTITCGGGLPSSMYWEQDDTYELVGPSTTVLHDPDADFVAWGVSIGDEVRNTAKNASGTITSVGQYTITCEGGLEGGKTWETNNGYEIGGAATAMLDATYRLEKANIDTIHNNETFTITQFVEGLASFLTGLNNNDCGTGFSGDACARLSLMVYNDSTPKYLGDLSYWTTLGVTPTVSAPQGLIYAVANMKLDWTLLTLALEMLPDELERQLDGRVTDTQLPMIGPILDAGADVPGALRDFVGGLSSLGLELVDFVATYDITSTVQTQIWDMVGSVSLSLLDSDDSGNVSIDDIIVTPDCGAGGCGGVYDIDDLTVTIVIGEGVAASETITKGWACSSAISTTVPFDVGLPGMTMYSDDELGVTYGWTLTVTFGLSREDGPYLAVGSADELVLGAKVQFKNHDPSCSSSSSTNCDFDYSSGDLPDGLTGFSGSRWVEGLLG